MARVFPSDDWSTNQHAPSPIHDDRIAADGIFEVAMMSKGRARQVSLPLSAAPDISASFQSMSLGTDSGYHPREDAKKDRGIRGLLRRASVSIKSKATRRHSHAVEGRPSTSYAPWLNRLRGAASFHRNSVFHEDYDYEAAVDSCTEFMSPIPGYGDAPPIIPIGCGGAAARATAAAQNEYFGRYRQFLSPHEHFGDSESGIGIAMSPSESTSSYQDTSISRVDFIAALPTELAIQILAHVDHHTLYNTALVSRAWGRVSSSQHVWRETFLREKSKTYAMSMPVQPGSMLGVPPQRPDNDWKELYRVREQLEDHWRRGKAEPVYLNGHVDSIYCIQFDEYVMP
jgi:F-box and WD-40 domain protein 1/11